MFFDQINTKVIFLNISNFLSYFWFEEFKNFDNRMSSQKFKKKYEKYVEGIDPISKIPYKVAVGPERFLAP